MSITAMKLALEALEYPLNQSHENFNVDMAELISHRAITSLRQAIEQAELVQRAEEAFDRSEQYVMQNAQGNLERISLVQTGVGIGTHPVAWMYDFLNPDSTDEVIRNWVTQDLSEVDGALGFNVRPLYTVPPQRQPLTEEEIAKIASTPCAVVGSYVHTFARAIEAAHGITQGQPVADGHVTDGTKCWCEPELDYKDPDTGAEVWIHRGKQ